MPITANKKIILTGSPFAWVHLISYDNINNKWIITEKWKFDNLQSSTYKILKPGTTTTGGENIDITRADGAIWRFPKTTLILSGINENDITPPDASSDATNKGEITLVTNEAPMEENSWTAFIKELQTHLNSKFMVTIGTGYSYEARTNTGLRKPEGFVYMIGKINSDIEQQLSNNPVSLSITFISCTNSGLLAGDLTQAVFNAITWKLGGGVGDPGVTPSQITNDDETKLLNGDIVVKVNINYP